MKRIVTVAGCKGGVGKSVIASAIGLELGRLGWNVILVDADLGGANLHTYLGIQAPKRVISDFLSHQVKRIEEIVLETEFPGIRFISGAGNAPSQANPKFAQKTKLINSVRSLEADFVIVDIGAGSSYDVMDFFSMTDDGILVSTPEPTSIVNSYGFMKNVVYRRFCGAFRPYPPVMELMKSGMAPDSCGGISTVRELLGELVKVNPECWMKAKEILSRFRPNIVMNMIASEADIGLGEKLRTIIGKYLSVEAKCLGEVVEDSVLRTAARRMTPFSVFAPECKAALRVKEIVRRLIPSEDNGTGSAEEIMEEQFALD